MFETRYRKLNEQIAPGDALLEDTLAQMAQHRRPKRRLHRTVAICAAAALLIGCGTPALAANVPGIYEVLYTLSPATAQFFMPVNKSCEDNGVKMEVVSAFVKDDTAGVYLTMQDIAGDRFDGTLDLFDSYSLHYPVRSGQSGGCTAIEYDTETRTATFLIEISNMDGERFQSGKYTFSVRQLLTGRQDMDGILVAAGLPDVPLDPPTEEHSPSGGSYLSEPGFDMSSNYPFLVPQGTLWESEDGVFSLVAAGYRDGQLHLQYRTHKVYDNHAWFQLFAPDGEEIEPAYTISHLDHEAGLSYDEFVYDMAYEDLAGCMATGDLATSDTLIEGNWRVTFRLDAAQ
ncbi:DUF4179 domain-containing protein [Agathobaculum sp.]|uniref:DUF4179 domain-containing protein n=1 Tax=Agathobaculum sp. TaxID=2048138 RepID=UPI002A80A89B|nr:DUF4179 domain-containing protein [Agathobaculum sp.]MDY3619186.1 DUF4179 domain-containing protein [Agathobaculum sp.]